MSSKIQQVIGKLLMVIFHFTCVHFFNLRVIGLVHWNFVSIFVPLIKMLFSKTFNVLKWKEVVDSLGDFYENNKKSWFCSLWSLDKPSMKPLNLSFNIFNNHQLLFRRWLKRIINVTIRSSLCHLEIESNDRSWMSREKDHHHYRHDHLARSFFFTSLRFIVSKCEWTVMVRFKRSTIYSQVTTEKILLTLCTFRCLFFHSQISHSLFANSLNTNRVKRKKKYRRKKSKYRGITMKAVYGHDEEKYWKIAFCLITAATSALH